MRRLNIAAVPLTGRHLRIPPALAKMAGLRGPTIVLAGCGRFFEILSVKAHNVQKRRERRALGRLPKGLLSDLLSDMETTG